MSERYVKIIITGCDDSNQFAMNVSDLEYNFLETLSKMSVSNSENNCQPIIELKPYDNSDMYYDFIKALEDKILFGKEGTARIENEQYKIEFTLRKKKNDN